MQRLLAKLPAFALPFVTRSLRGGRGNRYALLSLALTVVTVLLGSWLAFGPGSTEQEFRVDLGLERSQAEVQADEFVVFARTRAQYDLASEEASRMREATLDQPQTAIHNELAYLQQQAMAKLVMAAMATPPDDPAQLELYTKARALTYTSEQGSGWFPWADLTEVDKLERMVELRGVPEVRLYESPLGLRGAMTVLGFLAGVLLCGCVTVVLPILVGIQQAQEQHENTLTPLTGTGLQAPALALGLASGPAAVVAIFAFPQLLLMVIGALGGGVPHMAALLLIALAAAGVFTTLAAQLLGHIVGPKRTAGVVAIVLMAGLGLAWLAGSGAAAQVDRETAGLPALLPTMGLDLLLVQAFGIHVAAAEFATFAALAWSAAGVVFSVLVLRVLAHKIEGRQAAPLSAKEALLGAATCVALMQIAMPHAFHNDDPIQLFVGLGALALPFSLLLMARVPTGDNPPRMRHVPVPALVLEFAAWAVLHAVATSLVFETSVLAVNPIALVWLAWTTIVLALAAIRAVAIAPTIRAHLFLGVCAVAVIGGFVQSTVWGFGEGRSAGDVFSMFHLGPVAGLIQLAMTFGVPFALIASLRRQLGSIGWSATPTEASIPKKTR